LSACKSEPGDPEPPPELGGSPVGVGWLGSGLWTGFPAKIKKNQWKTRCAQEAEATSQPHLC